MIKVNTATQAMTREAIPKGLRGLTVDTLRNLQTELVPVPDDYADMEFWPEDITHPTLTDTEKEGAEIFTIDVPNKQVLVTYPVENKTAGELQAEADAAQAQAETTATETFIAGRTASLPATYDDMDIEVLKILRQEVYNFDESAANTPLCAIVATALSKTETQVRNSVRTKGNAYYVGLVTGWADRRAVIGDA